MILNLKAVFITAFFYGNFLDVTSA